MTVEDIVVKDEETKNAVVKQVEKEYGKQYEPSTKNVLLFGKLYSATFGELGQLVEVKKYLTIGDKHD